MHHTPPRRRRTRPLALLASLAAAAAGVTFTATAAHADTPVTTSTAQHIAVPAYISPTGAGATAWGEIASGAGGGGIAVANVANGPGNSADTDWAKVIHDAHSAGVKVLGYVDTGYLGTTDPARLTRLRDTSAEAWVAQAESDVNAWYRLYGSDIDGIFFDDGTNVCGPTDGSTAYTDTYAQLNRYVKQYHPGARTILNPGINVPQCYADTADTLLTFEGSYSDYASADSATRFIPEDWESGYDPDKFMHVIYGVPAASLQDAVNRSKNNRAGYVYATDAGLPNPYGVLSGDWSSELAMLAVPSTGTPAAPAQPQSGDVTGTSATLTWPADDSAAGYDVYRDGVLSASVTRPAGGTASFTATGLTPSTSYAFTVRARSLAGDVSAAAPAANVTTAAPDADPPTAPGTPSAGDLKPNSVRLTWAASSDDDAVASYEIYQDGTRILTLPATQTSVRFDGLAPGQGYSFTVVARDASGGTSAASGAAAVTTPDPDPAIGDTAATLTSDTATFSAAYHLEWTWHEVCVDSDDSAATGYALSLGGVQVGCDRLIQEDTVYTYSGTGTDWSWTSEDTDAQPSVSDDTYSWRIPASDLGGGVTTAKVAFGGSGYSPGAWSAPLTLTRQ